MGKHISDINFKKRVYDLVEDEYVFLENYNGALVKILCKHNECGTSWKIRPNDFYNGHRCPKCSKRKIKDDMSFKDEISSLVNKEYIFLETYMGRNKKIKCQHCFCDFIWEVTPNDFINNGVRCPKCRKRYRRSSDDFNKEILKLTNGEYTFLEDFVNVKHKIKCRHNKCNKIFYVTPNNFLGGSRCPYCSNISRGENRIRKFCEENGISFIQHKTFNWSKKRIYDFYLIDYNLLIEYNGIQHYKETNFFKISLDEQVKIDVEKRKMALEHNYDYLIIPHTDFNRIEDILLEKLKLRGV